MTTLLLAFKRNHEMKVAIELLSFHFALPTTSLFQVKFYFEL